VANNLLLARELESQALDALSKYDFPEPTQIQLLSFSENAVYRAEFAGHDPVVVRLHSLGYHNRTAIESELQWVEALCADTDVVTPGVVRSRRGQTVVTASHSELPSRFAVVFECLNGQEPTSESLRSDFCLLGRTTAMMHDHARGWPRPPEFHRFRWDLDGTIGRTPHWGFWQSGPRLQSDTVAVLERAADLIAERLSAFGQLPTRFGLIHADLRLANLLMNGPTVQVIDFDDCGFGWFMYDLASALTFMEDDPQVPELVSAWLEGYREERPLDASDAREIPTFLMLRRLVILAWLGSRPETELVQSLGESYARVTGDLAESYLSLMTRPAKDLAKAVPWS
jgi:Ser/Thr protein kinase RdoA (MazF antagonist)